MATTYSRNALRWRAWSGRTPILGELLGELYRDVKDGSLSGQEGGEADHLIATAETVRLEDSFVPSYVNR